MHNHLDNDELAYEKNRLLKHIWGYCALDMYKDAVDECKKLIDIDPNDPESFIQLGFHYEENKETDKAIECYSLVMRRFPQYSYSYVNLGYIFETYKKRNDIAVVCYEKAAELNPNDEWALNNIGAILQKEGKWKDALSYYERACEVSKKNDGVECYQILHNLAWAYYHCKNYGEASLIYRDLTNEYPDNASMYGDFGCVYYKIHRYSNALNLFKKALSIQPNNKHYQRLYQLADKKRE
jgi:tetratricopeptide (TPR) repeat protein